MLEGPTPGSYVLSLPVSSLLVMTSLDACERWSSCRKTRSGLGNFVPWKLRRRECLALFSPKGTFRKSLGGRPFRRVSCLRSGGWGPVLRTLASWHGSPAQRAAGNDCGRSVHFAAFAGSLLPASVPFQRLRSEGLPWEHSSTLGQAAGWELALGLSFGWGGLQESEEEAAWQGVYGNEVAKASDKAGSPYPALRFLLPLSRCVGLPSSRRCFSGCH